jgi:hypothetical protein
MKVQWYLLGAVGLGVLLYLPCFLVCELVSLKNLHPEAIDKNPADDF